jgi:MFS family permease
MSDAVQPSPVPPDADATPPIFGNARSAMAIVFVVVVIDLLGFGIVLPLLPRYGEAYVGQLLFSDQQAVAAEAVLTAGAADGQGPWASLAVLTADVTRRQGWFERLILGGGVGLLMASFSLMQFVFAPIWGRVSDRVGRRPILLLGLGGSVVFYALFGFASDLPPVQWAGVALALLFLARIGAGVAGATISTAQAVIADCTTPEKRKHGMALIGAAFGVGFTLGPIIASLALIALPGWHGVVGYIAAGLSLAALGLGLARLPETRRFGAPILDRKWIDFQAAGAALRSSAVGPVILAFFLATLGFGGFEATLSLLNKDALGLTDAQNGGLFTYVGFVLVLAQGGLYRPLAKRLHEPALMAAGMVLMGLGVASLGGVTYMAMVQGLGFGWSLAWVMVSLTFAVVGFALLTPSAQALISRRSDPEKQGEILGVNQSASALARILGPIIGVGLFFATPAHLLPYGFGGGLALLMLLLIPRIRRGELAAHVHAAPPPATTEARDLIDRLAAEGAAPVGPEEQVRRGIDEVRRPGG